MRSIAGPPRTRCYPVKMHDTTTGYRELEHTADWELEVWAPDMAELLEIAARGMYHLMGVELDPGPRQDRRLTLEAADREALLVDFLGELLFIHEAEGVVFDDFDLTVDGGRLEAALTGSSAGTKAKEIKAVTYHGLRVAETERGVETRVVFDV